MRKRNLLMCGDADEAVIAVPLKTSRVSIGTAGAGACSACGDPCLAGSRWCSFHKKCMDSMYRYSMGKDAREPPAHLKDDDLEWDETLKAWLGSDYWMFVNVFGDDKARKEGKWPWIAFAMAPVCTYQKKHHITAATIEQSLFSP